MFMSVISVRDTSCCWCVCVWTENRSLCQREQMPAVVQLQVQAPTAGHLPHRKMWVCQGWSGFLLSLTLYRNFMLGWIPSAFNTVPKLCARVDSFCLSFCTQSPFCSWFLLSFVYTGVGSLCLSHCTQTSHWGGFLLSLSLYPNSTLGWIPSVFKSVPKLHTGVDSFCL